MAGTQVFVKWTNTCLKSILGSIIALRISSEFLNISPLPLASSAFTLWFKPYTHSSGKEPMFSRSFLLLSFKCLSPSLPLSFLSCLNSVGLQDSSGLAPCKNLPQGPAPSLATSSMHAHCAHHLLLQWVLNFSALRLHPAPWGQCLHLIHL